MNEVGISLKFRRSFLWSNCIVSYPRPPGFVARVVLCCVLDADEALGGGGNRGDDTDDGSAGIELDGKHIDDNPVYGRP